MESLQSVVVSFLNLINLLLGSKAGVKYRMLLMCPGAGQDLLDMRLWMHIPYLFDKIYRGPEIYSACKILLNVGVSCAMTIVWECIVSAGRKMVTSLPDLTQLPGALGQRRRCSGRDARSQMMLPGAVVRQLGAAPSSHPAEEGHMGKGEGPSKGRCWGKRLFDQGGNEGLTISPRCVSSVL